MNGIHSIRRIAQIGKVFDTIAFACNLVCCFGFLPSKATTQLNLDLETPLLLEFLPIANCSLLQYKGEIYSAFFAWAAIDKLKATTKAAIPAHPHTIPTCYPHTFSYTRAIDLSSTPTSHTSSSLPTTLGSLVIEIQALKTSLRQGDSPKSDLYPSRQCLGQSMYPFPSPVTAWMMP